MCRKEFPKKMGSFCSFLWALKQCKPSDLVLNLTMRALPLTEYKLLVNHWCASSMPSLIYFFWLEEFEAKLN